MGNFAGRVHSPLASGKPRVSHRRTLYPVDAFPVLLLQGGMSTPSQVLNSLRFTLLAGALTATTVLNAAPTWIWSSPKNQAKPNEQVYFRKSFDLTQGAKKATLFGSCDNGMTVWINGREVAKSDVWQTPVKVGVKGSLAKGSNVIAVHGRNDGGKVAGLIIKLDLELADGSKRTVESGKSWTFSHSKPRRWRRANFDDSAWSAAVELGSYGSGPWGKLGEGRPPRKGESLASDQISAPDGFVVERLYSVPKSEQGSWVSLAKDHRGRLIASDQGGKGLYRIDVSGAEVEVEKIPVDISGAHGLLWAFDGLYVHVSGKGLYRLTDSDGDDRLDAVEDLLGSRGGGEHGNHAVVLTEDERALYIVAGNHTNLPQSITGSRLPAEWHEDILLPRRWDARGHAKGRLAPGGWVCRVTPDARKWEIVSVGYRNQYDVAVNRHGEVFTYDADMEWDMGMPWYRPTRICHLVSGSEFGWRSGTGKWPSYYEDGLPAAVDIGPGSPTGTVFGRGAKFPAKYQDALFALDWTFGTIWAVHLKAQSASYTAEKEDFISGSPLPVTDAVVGDDGALYFTVGGRNTQSGLYRVTYDGSESTAPVTGEHDDLKTAQARAARKRLEQYHGVPHPDAVEAAWPYLGDEDRFLRYAARLALEAQPLERWRERALADPDPRARITGAIALARVGRPQVKEDLLGALDALEPAVLSESSLLSLLRAYGLCFTRFGPPSTAQAEKLMAKFDPLLPSDSEAVSLELVKLLVYLDAPSIVEKGLALMIKERPARPPDWSQVLTRNGGYGGTIQRMLDDPPPTQGLAYAFALRNVRYGWSLGQRRTYLAFLKEAAEHTGGASYKGFLENIRGDFLGNSSPAERAALAELTGEKLDAPAIVAVTAPKGPGRAWTVDEAAAAIGIKLANRNFDSGRNLFHATACASCHLFDGVGGAIGPDLSTVRNKFSHRDLLEAIIEPSKVISDQYGSKQVTMKDGTIHLGLVVEKRDSDTLEIYLPDPEAPAVTVKADDVASVKESPVSQMPPGLINTLNQDELTDLVAYLMSRGNREDAAFKR